MLLLLLVAGGAEASPNSVAYERGARALRQGQPEEAAAALEDALAESPEDPALLSLYGQALLLSSRPAEAADVFSRLRAADPNAQGVAYYEGLARYQLKEWAEARAHFEQAFQERSDDGTLQLLIGITYQEEADVLSAEAAYAEALRLSPDLEGEVAFRRAVIAFEDGRDEDAYQGFVKVRQRLPDSELALTADKYLEALQGRPNRFWNVFATLGIGYDSNVNLANDDGDGFATGLDDGLGLAEVGGSILALDMDRFRIRLGQSGFFNFHFRETDVNQIISRSWAQGRAQVSEQVELRTGYTYEFVWVDTSQFRSTHAVQQSVWYTPLPNLQAQAYGRYETRNFQKSVPSDLSRDGNIWRAGLNFYWYLPETSFGGNYVRVGYRFRDENDQGDQFDSQGHAPVVTVGVALPLEVDLTLDARYERRDFGRPATFTPCGNCGDRSDGIANLWVNLRRPVIGDLIGDLSYAYTNRDSNDDFFDYDRHLVVFSLTYSY